MRDYFLRRLCPEMTARDAVLLLLTSDKEASQSPSEYGINKGHGRTVKDIFSFNPRIDHKTLYRLVEEGLIERVGFNYRLKMYPVGRTA